MAAPIITPATAPTRTCHAAPPVLTAPFSSADAEADVVTRALEMVDNLTNGAVDRTGALVITGVIDAGATTPADGDGTATQSDDAGMGWASGVGEE